MANTTMTYGAYEFSPVPLLEIGKDIIRSGDESTLQELTTITITGTLVASPYLATDAGIDYVKGAMDDLRDAFKTDCSLFLVQCGSTDIVRARPRVKQAPKFTPTGNNWVQTAQYTIVLEFSVEVGESSAYAANIKSASETWSIEFADDNSQYTETIQTGADHIPYTMRLTHSLSAEGIAECSQPSGTGSTTFAQAGWQEARDWVLPRLGFDSSYLNSGVSGIINVDPNDLGIYNHMRTNSLNEVNGSFEVTETWLLINTGISGLASPGAIEDFTVTINSSLSQPTTTVRVEGSIQGLEGRTYGSGVGDFSVTQEKYSNALTYWNVVEDRLYARCKAVADTASLPRPLSTSALSYNVAHAKPKGIITYTYEFDNRVCFLLNQSGSLSGQVLSEIITVNDVFPNDVFAVIPILGRAAGPVLQEISTVTEKKRDISIELLVQPPTGCSLSSWNTYRDTVKGSVDDLLCEFETELTSSADQVFKHNDTQSWIPQQGRYTRQIGWTYQNCSGTNNTSVC